MDPPVVSIIIPTRNRRELLAEAVRSVLEQTFHEWELIVVDDASDDGTGAWLDRIEDCRVHHLSLETHSERNTARNKGLSAACGRYVLFLDDDDLLSESALQVQVAALEKHPAAIGSIGGYAVFDEKGSRRAVRIVRRERVREIWEEIFFGWNVVSGQCVFRIDSLRAAGGWDESYTVGEDHELWLRLLRLGPVVLLPDEVLRYRVHRGQWRPRNLSRLLNRIRKEALARLDGRDRQQGEALLRARTLHEAAAEHYGRGEFRAALTAGLRGVRSRPGLLLSPLTRRLVVVPILKYCCGAPGRAVAARSRGLRREQLTISADTGVESDGRWYGSDRHKG